MTQDQWPERLFPSEALVEIRYEENFRLLDHLGRLSHDLDEFFSDVEVTPQSHLELKMEGAPLGHVARAATVVAQVPGESQNDFLTRFRTVWEIVSEALEIPYTTRVGIRSAYLVGFDKVEEAVLGFRQMFFDYYAGLLDGMGKPVEVQAQTRFDSWASWEGVPFSLLVRVMPIHVLPALQQVLQEERFAGALVFDLDRYAVEPLEPVLVPDATAYGLYAGHATAEELLKRAEGLNEGGESGVA